MSATRKRRVQVSLIDPEKKQTRAERTEEITLDPKEIDGRFLVTRLAKAYAGMIEYYEIYGKKSPEEAREIAAGSRENDRTWLARKSPAQLTWHDLAAVGEKDMEAGLDLWSKVKSAARDWIESGGHVIETVEGSSSPFQHAQLAALREQLTEGWQPQNGIERVLIDMLMQSYALHLYWTGIAHERATREADGLHEAKKKSPYRSEQTWKIPSISAFEATEQAYKLADGYHRQFMRALRQLRDMRRYKLIIQNPNQVNIGNQQINVSDTGG